MQELTVANTGASEPSASGLWVQLQAILQRGNSAVLVIVVESEGSAPGKLGFKMVVGQQARTCGTIGGGIMEANIIETCNAMLADGESANLLIPQIHHERAPADQRSGMICAGRQTLLLQPLQVDDAHLLAEIAKADAGSVASQITITEKGLQFLAAKSVAPRPNFTSTKTSWQYSEPLGDPDRLYIVGGGHVGSAISQVFSHLDFQITVFDHRHDLPLLQRCDHLHDIIVGPYGEIANHMVAGNKSYVAVVTAAFTSDVEALASVLPWSWRYLGLMGSKAKINRIFANLRDLGFDQNQCEAITAPLGLPITNRTPAEIAISLAAQVISIRNAPAKN